MEITQGALRAAYEIILAGFGDPGKADEQAEFLAKIIDKETAAHDLLEIAVAVANWDNQNSTTHIKEMAREALAKAGAT